MHRVDTTTAIASLPSSQTAGTPGFFTKGDPSTPTPATVPGPDWFNMIQEELYYLVATAGLTPDATKADFTQVHEAIAAMIAARTLAGNTDVTLTSPASGQALVYNGSAWVNGTPASAIAEVQKTLLLNSLRDAIAEGAGSQLVNSWPDPLVDTSGIDTGASTGYEHDAANDIIHNGGELPDTDITSGETVLAENETNKANLIDDNTANEWLSTAQGAGNIGVSFVGIQFASAKRVRKVTILERQIGNNLNWIDSVQVQYSDDGSSWSDGDLLSLSTVYSTTKQSFDLSDDGSHEYWRLLANGAPQGGGTYSWGVAEIEMMAQSETTNIDVTTVQRNPLAVPTTGHFIMLVNNTGTNVYGTDITVEMSRDDGSTYDTATIEELGTTTVTIDGAPVDCDVLYIEPTFTGASEQNLRVHIESFNNKTFQIAGLIPASS